MSNEKKLAVSAGKGLHLPESRLEQTEDFAQVVKERDALLAEVGRLSKLENSLPASLRDAHVVVEELRDEVERLRADRDRLHGILQDRTYDEDKVAARQREACAVRARDWQNSSVICTSAEDAVRATTLVTEVNK